jgi:hypothetical protein
MIRSVVVTHTPWIAERVKSFARLDAQLRGELELDSTTRYTVVGDRGPISFWSELAWRAALHATHWGDWALFLQDDLALCPRYLATAEALLGSAPSSIVGLETVHPAARELARAGRRWCTTADGLIGRAYALRLDELGAFLDWRRDQLRLGATDAITEDTLLGVYALATGRPIAHPIPSPQLHDLTQASAQGNERDAYRTASVLWTDGDVCGWRLEELVRPTFWAEPGPTPHLGRIWKTTPWIAKQWVKGWTDERHARALADACPQPYAAKCGLS